MVHEDEINYIKQQIKNLGIDVIPCNESEAKNILEQLDKSDAKDYSKNKQKREKPRPKKINKNEKLNSHQDEIEELYRIITDLRHKGKKAVASRDKWKKRAFVAEKQLSKNSGSNDVKFKQVKKSFSKTYHPDSLRGDKFEKMIKQEIFKEFWQIIESIEKNQT